MVSSGDCGSDTPLGICGCASTAPLPDLASVFAPVSSSAVHEHHDMSFDIQSISPFVKNILKEQCCPVNDCLAGDAAGLDELSIPHAPAAGAVFLLMDLRKWLPEPTWEVRAHQEILLYDSVHFADTSVALPR